MKNKTFYDLKNIFVLWSTQSLSQLGSAIKGFAWILDSKNNVIWHNSGTGNYNCYLGLNLKQQKAVIVLSNLATGYRIPATVIGVKLFQK